MRKLKKKQLRSFIYTYFWDDLVDNFIRTTSLGV